MKIGYYLFGEDSLCYGLSFCAYKNSVKMEPVTKKTIKYCDVVLFSIYWWKHVVEFIELCEELRVGKKFSSSVRLVVGGFNTYNPEIFKHYAHVVVVGDGDEIINDAINGIGNDSFYTGTEKKVMYAQADIINNSYCFLNNSNTPRIEIARGCKYKCKFCQLTALKKYREASYEAIEKAVMNARGKKLVLFAPNKTSHSATNKIQELLLRTGKHDACPDVRFNEFDKYYGSNSPQIGIEGISERLRFSVGKFLKDGELLAIFQKVIDIAILKGHKPVVSLGYIVDLPGETEEDWVCFSSFLDSVQSLDKCEHLNLFFIFNVFQPMPFTPFENEHVNIGKDYQKKLRKVLYDRKFKICVRGKLHSDYSRVLSAMTNRGDENTADELIKIIKSKKTKMSTDITTRIDSILRYTRGGLGYYLGTPQQRPWDIVKVVH